MGMQMEINMLDTSGKWVYTRCMIKYNFYMTHHQLTSLDWLAMRSGVKISEHLRRAIDEYLERHKDDFQEESITPAGRQSPSANITPSAIPNARTSHVPRSDPADSRGGKNDQAGMERPKHLYPPARSPVADSPGGRQVLHADCN